MYSLSTSGNRKPFILACLVLLGLSQNLWAQDFGTVDGLARAESGAETAASDDFDPASTDFTVEDNFSGETADTFNPVQLGSAARADLFGTNYFEVRGNAGADSPDGPQVHNGSTDAYSRVRGFDELYFTKGDGNAATSSFSVSLLNEFGSNPNVLPQADRTSPNAGLSMSVRVRVYDAAYENALFDQTVNYLHNISYFEGNGETTVTQTGDNLQWINFVVNPGDHVILNYELSGEANSGPYDNQDILINTDPFTYEGYSSGANYFGKLFVGIDDITSTEGIVYSGSMTGIDYSAANVPEPQWTALGLSLLCLLWAQYRRRQ